MLFNIQVNYLKKHLAVLINWKGGHGTADGLNL